MPFNSKQCFNYKKEKCDDIFCINIKSFYTCCECVERGLNPLITLLVVMSGEGSLGCLALAGSPMAKPEFGITTVTRNYEISRDPRFWIVPLRMNLYLQKNMLINIIFRRYVADEDILVYSIDETFVRVRAS